MSTRRDVTVWRGNGPPPQEITSSFHQQTISITTIEWVDAGAGRRFVERPHLRQEDLEYPRPGSEPGLILIFNQVTFDDDPQEKKRRYGSTRDVNEIVKCMQHHGYNVESENIVTNGTREKILNKLQEVSEKDHSEANSLIVFFLSHGREFNMLCTKDGTIQTYDVWKPFLNCEWLQNKPKMFIFQACKGASASTLPLNPSSPLQKKDETSSVILPRNTLTSIGPDMVVVYSTIEGKVSFRDELRGTWFIQELCRAFYMYGRRDDVLSLITRATKCVSRNYFELQPTYGHIEKQMPMYVSTLTKKFYLNRNKDRDQALKVLHDGRKILEAVKNLQEKIHFH